MAKREARITTEQIIQQLRANGFYVKARKRSDGGYLITQIDNLKFKGASGNRYARESILGIELSKAQIEQRKAITKSRVVRKRLPTIPDDVRKQINRIRNRFKRKGQEWGT